MHLIIGRKWQIGNESGGVENQLYIHHVKEKEAAPITANKRQKKWMAVSLLLLSFCPWVIVCPTFYSIMFPSVNYMYILCLFTFLICLSFYTLSSGPVFSTMVIKVSSYLNTSLWASAMSSVKYSLRPLETRYVSVVGTLLRFLSRQN